MSLTHLEYSFHLATCNLSNRTRTFANPFTGMPSTVPVDDGLTRRECDALRELIQATGFTRSQIPGEGFELQLSRDEDIRLRGEIEPADCGFAVEIVVRSLPDYVLDLILSIARTGNFALTSYTGKDVRLSQDPTDQLVKERWRNAPILRTRDDLRQWLEQVIRARPVRIDTA